MELQNLCFFLKITLPSTCLYAHQNSAFIWDILLAENNVSKALLNLNKQVFCLLTPVNYYSFVLFFQPDNLPTQLILLWCKQDEIPLLVVPYYLGESLLANWQGILCPFATFPGLNASNSVICGYLLCSLCTCIILAIRHCETFISRVLCCWY